MEYMKILAQSVIPLVPYAIKIILVSLASIPIQDYLINKKNVFGVPNPYAKFVFKQIRTYVFNAKKPHSSIMEFVNNAQMNVMIALLQIIVSHVWKGFL